MKCKKCGGIMKAYCLHKTRESILTDISYQCFNCKTIVKVPVDRFGNRMAASSYRYSRI